MNRREMMLATIAGTAGASSLTRLAGAEGRPAAAADREPHAAAVTTGVSYFRRRAAEQLPLVKRLRDAAASGDLRAAQRAYLEARPPYEEIETIANCFVETDRDIDARPYAFEGGETDAEFRGFHKIEALLFGHEDARAAAPFASGLVGSVGRLIGELAERDRFSAAGQFDGMIALATEVAAKKISSEEETWSDQSLLIFRHNWIGVLSQYAPFAPFVGEARVRDRVFVAYKHAMALVEPHFAEGEAWGTPYSRIRMRERRLMADASNGLRDALVAARGSLGV